MATYLVFILPSSLITDLGIYSELQCAQLKDYILLPPWNPGRD